MSRRRVIAALVAAAASALALSACAPADPAPPGPTSAEVDAVVAGQLEARWAAFGVPAPQPAVARVEFVNLDNRPYKQLECYQAEGLDATEVSGDFTVGGFLPGDPRAAQPYALQVAIFTCNAQYPLDPLDVGYLTDAQALYMYDYFNDRLAPCLRLLGYPVAAATPRDDYVKALRSGVYWDPYFTESHIAITDSADALDRIDLRCPPLGKPYGYYHPTGRIGP